MSSPPELHKHQNLHPLSPNRFHLASSQYFPLALAHILKISKFNIQPRAIETPHAQRRQDKALDLAGQRPGASSPRRLESQPTQLGHAQGRGETRDIQSVTVTVTVTETELRVKGGPGSGTAEYAPDNTRFGPSRGRERWNAERRRSKGGDLAVSNVSEPWSRLTAGRWGGEGGRQGSPGHLLTQYQSSQPCCLHLQIS